jgi:glycosyltransferase involved in cell wall biosynthesis
MTRRPKVLQLCSHPPFPPDQGGKIRSFHLLKALHEIADVNLVCFQHTPDERQAGDALVDLGFPIISLVPVPSYTATWWHHLRSINPLLAQRYGLTTLTDATRAHLSTTSYDAIIVDGPDALLASIGIERVTRAPLVYIAHNVESEVYRRCLALARRSLKSAVVAHVDYVKMVRLEHARARTFGAVVTVSTRDARVFQRWAPAASVHVIPNGADCSYFAPMDIRPEPGAIVFTGTLNYAPNRDAISYFADRIFPRIRGGFPSAIWYVVGRDLDGVGRSLQGRSGIVPTGYVEDVRPYLGRAQVIAVPLRAGGGTRLKILEAMAMARPIVSTTVGAEGLELDAGEHLLLADEPDAFADAVIGVLRHPERAQAMATRARAAVLERYDWRAISQRYVEAILSFCRATPALAESDAHGR